MADHCSSRITSDADFSLHTLIGKSVAYDYDHPDLPLTRSPKWPGLSFVIAHIDCRVCTPSVWRRSSDVTWGSMSTWSTDAMASIGYSWMVRR